MEREGDAADLGVLEAAESLRARELSAVELTEACLARIEQRNGGAPTFDGAPDAINAFVRVYADDARAAAQEADAQLARGDAPPLCGVPLALKDLYAAAGHPTTASSRVLEDAPPERARRRDVGAPARRGDGAGGPHAQPRVGGRRDDRPGRQPVGRQPQRRRFQRRVGRGAGRGHGACGAGLGHLRLAAHPGRGVRDRRDQADPRPPAADRRAAAGLDAGPSGSDGPHGRRLRGAVQRDGRRRGRHHPAVAPAGADRRAADGGPRRRPAAGGHAPGADRPRRRAGARARHRRGPRRDPRRGRAARSRDRRAPQRRLADRRGPQHDPAGRHARPPRPLRGRARSLPGIDSRAAGAGRRSRRAGRGLRRRADAAAPS